MKKVTFARLRNFQRYMTPRLVARALGPLNMLRSRQYLSQLRSLAILALRSNSGAIPGYIKVGSFDQNARGVLQETGTIVNDFLDPDLARTFGEKLISDTAEFSKEFPDHSVSKGTSASGINVVVGNTSMTALIGDGTPIANIRQGVDEGMVDFYNIDNHYPEALAIREKLLQAGVKEFLEEVSGRKLFLKSMNAYVNLDVTETRGFHVDAFGVTQIKVFVYLTDVDDLKNGPYCYVLGSHQEKPLQGVNSFASRVLGLSDTDLVMINFENAFPILGQAGTLIISDQSGAHRGFPQETGGRRALAVFNFFQAN